MPATEEMTEIMDETEVLGETHDTEAPEISPDDVMDDLDSNSDAESPNPTPNGQVSIMAKKRGRPPTPKHVEPEDESQEVEDDQDEETEDNEDTETTSSAAISSGPISKTAAVHAAIDAGYLKPAEGVAWIAKTFGIEVGNQYFSGIRSRAGKAEKEGGETTEANANAKAPTVTSPVSAAPTGQPAPVKVKGKPGRKPKDARSPMDDVKAAGVVPAVPASSPVPTAVVSTPIPASPASPSPVPPTRMMAASPVAQSASPVAPDIVNVIGSVKELIATVGAEQLKKLVDLLG